ncbi:MAG: proprotein convertase P-domain-containing protein [Flavobacteriales bacterium]|nr:proprotein convertase P-domain-containing protein [Flavobacteriales bacterium]
MVHIRIDGGISFSGIAPTIIIPVNPVTNTTYTISSLSDDNCTALPVNLSGSATITVNPLPTAFTITPSSVTICEGAIQALTAVGGAPVNGSKTAASGNINVNIPDKSLFGATGVLTRTLNISGIPVNAVITSIVVTYRISHTATGDLNINLKAPNGNILNLVNQRGGTGDDFNTTTISSLSSTPITTGSNPYNNTYAADAKNAIGSPANQSNVTNFAGLYGGQMVHTPYC